MTDNLINLKVTLGIKDNEQDELLNLMIEDAKSDILSYTKRREDEWLPAFDVFMRRIIVARYNRMGDDGVVSRTEGSVSVSYSEDNILSELNCYRILLR